MLEYLIRVYEADARHLQSNIEELIKSFETLTKYVSVLGLFSRNENIEEIATTDLRYVYRRTLARLNIYFMLCALSVDSSFYPRTSRSLH